MCDGKYEIQSGSYDKDFFYAELFLIFPSYIHSISSSAYKCVRRSDTGLLNVTVDDDISVMCDGKYEIQSGSYTKDFFYAELFLIFPSYIHSINSSAYKCVRRCDTGLLNVELSWVELVGGWDYMTGLV